MQIQLIELIKHHWNWSHTPSSDDLISGYQLVLARIRDLQFFRQGVHCCMLSWTTMASSFSCLWSCPCQATRYPHCDNGIGTLGGLLCLFGEVSGHRSSRALLHNCPTLPSPGPTHIRPNMRMEKVTWVTSWTSSTVLLLRRKEQQGEQSAHEVCSRFGGFAYSNLIWIA